MKEMTKDFVTYEQAVKLKECGFNWYGDYCYVTEPFCEGSSIRDFEAYTTGSIVEIRYIDDDTKVIPCPTISQAAKWLRDKHNLHVQIESVIGKRWTYTLVDTAPQSNMDGEYYDRIPDRNGYPVFDTYEVALSAGIDAALEMIKE